MSIRDKIRDELYGSMADERKSEANAAAIEEFADTMDRPYAAHMRIAVCALIEAALVAFVLIFPDRAREFAISAVYIAMLTAFGLGGAMGFAAAILFKQWRGDPLSALDSPEPDDPSSAEGLMSGYADEERRESQFRVWFDAAGVGVANIVFFYILLAIRN